MERNVVIVGAGGHAKVIIDIFRSNKLFKPIGVIDRIKSDLIVNSLKVIGDESELSVIRSLGVEFAHVAIGDNEIRSNLSKKIRYLGFNIASAVSSRAMLSESALVGDGVAVKPRAIVNSDCRLDDFCILNTASTLDHDGVIGEGAHVAPGCALAGNVSVGRLAFLGVGTSVIPGIAIGDEAIVGAGSCVIRPVPPRAKAYGVPARIVES